MCVFVCLPCVCVFLENITFSTSPYVSIGALMIVRFQNRIFSINERKKTAPAHRVTSFVSRARGARHHDPPDAPEAHAGGDGVDGVPGGAAAHPAARALHLPPVGALPRLPQAGPHRHALQGDHQPPHRHGEGAAVGRGEGSGRKREAG